MKKTILLLISVLLFSEIFALTTYVVTKPTDVDPFLHPYKFNDSDCDPEMYGTLQWAINKANDDGDHSRIEFNIPGNGPHEIDLINYLPQIKTPTIIDATTQPGYSDGNPSIIVSGQGKQNSIFNVYKTEVTIKGLHIKSFSENGILLTNCYDSNILNNKISNNSPYSSKTPYIGLFINGCDNISVFGNEIEILLNESVDGLTKSYGIYASKSTNCIIGGTDSGLSNTIKNCRTYGVFLNSTQTTLLSRNSIYNCEKAIYLNDSNDNINAPVITEYVDGLLKGTSLPNSTIEIFGSTGNQNANEYLTSILADAYGEWSIDINTSYNYFVSNQTKTNNISSGLSNSIENSSPTSGTTHLLSKYQNTDSVDLDDFLYARIINGAKQYQFNIIQTESGVNQIITKNVNYFSLLELENNEAYYNKEYTIKVRAVFENSATEWGESCILQTTNMQRYEYGIAHIRVLPEYNYAISTFEGIENSIPIDLEGFLDLNSQLQVSNIKKTFPRILNKLPDLYNIYTIKFNNEFSTDSLISWANQTDYFEYVSQYPIYRLFEVVNDPYLENPPTQCTFCDNNLGQWSLQQLNAEGTWDLLNEGEIVTIAIVDDAVRYDHIDLHDNIYINTGEIPENILSLLLSNYDTNSNNFVDANEFVNYCNNISPLSINNLHDVINNQNEFPEIFNGVDDDNNGNYVDDIIGWDASHDDNDPYPGIITTQGEITFTHGTHVAGISSAVTNNNEGIASLSNNRTRIIPVKIFLDTNEGTSLNNPKQGVEYAIAAGADIINMSWGGEFTDNITDYPLYSLITSAHDNLGITFIAAMGNDGEEVINAPACIPEVVAIGATNSNQLIADFSTTGSHMDFFAPGDDILSAYSIGVNEYFCANGTSMACPQVSALWALLKSINPNATFEQIYNCIASNCVIPGSWTTDCNETSDITPWSLDISKHWIINPYNTVLCFNNLPPVAMFEHLGGSICPGTEFYFYSTSSGGPISPEMTLSWTCLEPGVIFSTPNALNTNITFPDQGSYTIQFTIYDENNDVISQYEEVADVAFPKVNMINTDNFETCSGFEATVYLQFSGTPPFSFDYNLNGGEDITIVDIETPYYTLFVNESDILEADTPNSINITNISDYSCINTGYVFTFTFNTIDCDLCSRNHNNIMTWRGSQMQFSPSNTSQLSLPDDPYNESSCAITNNNGEPLLLMKGDYLYNLTTTNNNIITSSSFGYSSKEGSLILPHDSGNPNLYYSLVVADNGNTFPESLRYYVIDVSSPNAIHIIQSETASNNDLEVIIACKISDDYGYWLLTNSTNDNQINLYKLQNNLLEYQGNIDIQYFSALSPMCLSPDMNLLAVKNDTHITNIYNLNRESNCLNENRLSLIKTIEHVDFTPYYYEFSPNSQVFYSTGNSSIGEFTKKLHQYPVYDTENDPTFIVDELLIDIRLGGDNRMYIELMVPNENSKISVIKSPNEIGSECGYNSGQLEPNVTGIDLSRRIPEIPFNFYVNEEVLDCQINLIIDQLTGYGPYTYLWNDNSTNNYLNDVVPGEYFVTITDNFGCELTKSYEVTTLNYVTCSLIAANNMCYGTVNTGSVDFNIVGGEAPYVVELFKNGVSEEILNIPNAGDYSFQNLGIGDYLITVYDNNTCSFDTNFSIEEANEIQLSFSVLNIPCEGSNYGSAHVDVQLGEEPYSFLWSNGEDTQTAIHLSGEQDAFVTVTDNNSCTTTGSIFISSYDLPQVNLTASPQVICHNSNENVTLTANASGGTPAYTYTWESPIPDSENSETVIVTPEVTVPPTTTYTVTVTDQNNCSVSDIIEVEVENINITNSVTYDYGNEFGTVSFNFEPSDITLDDFTSVVIVDEGNTVYDVTGESMSYELPVGHTYTATFISENGCEYTSEFPITFIESFICSTAERPITCEYNFNGGINIDIQGGVSPYNVNVFIDGDIYNYSFNTPGEHTIDLAGTPPNDNIISISITDGNGEVSNHSHTGLDFAWADGINLTNDNVNNQYEYINEIIQIGEEYEQTLKVFEDITFTNCTIYTATYAYENIENTRWTVYNPNVLKLENTVVKSGCPDQMWQGILGTYEIVPGTDFNSSPPAQLLIYNSEIHDAIIAVESEEGVLKAATIKAVNSKFYNNQYDLYFNESSFSQGNSIIRGNEFITNRLLNDPSLFPKAHVYMERVSGITFRGNHFENTLEFSPYLPDDISFTADKLGKGIEARMSSFIVTPVYFFDNHAYPLNADNTFKGLYYGVDARGQKTYAPQVHHSTFVDNFRGVYMKGTSGARVLFNYISTTNRPLQFDMIGFSLNGTPSTDVAYGVYLNSAKDTKFEENTIVNGKTGAYVYNLGNDGTQFYGNEFGMNTQFVDETDNIPEYVPEGMKAASVVIGKNSDYISGNPEFPGLNGLEVRCNDYTENNYAISVINGNMRKNQGANSNNTKDLAGNQFHETFVNGKEFKTQIQNSTSSLFNYSHYDVGTYKYYQHDDYFSEINGKYRELKEENTIGVEGITQEGIEFYKDQSCPSHYSPRIFNHDDLIIGISSIKSTLTNLEGEYDRVVDKGDRFYMKTTAKLMDNSNYNEAFEILQNEGYLSDTVLIALLCNEVAPSDAISAILIENSPLPEEVITLIEEMPVHNNIRNWLSFYSAGLSNRVELEYEIADLKQDIIRIESDLFNNAINNDTLPGVKTDVINYFNSKSDAYYQDYIKVYKLELSLSLNEDARNTLNNMRSFANYLPQEKAEEIIMFCDVNEIFLNSVENENSDSILFANKGLLFEAASDMSTEYSAMAEILYSQTTDSVFYEYTPLPTDEITPKNITVYENTSDIFSPEFKVYPNPTKGLVFVEYNFDRTYEKGAELLLKALNLEKEVNCNTGIIKVYSEDSKLIKTINLDNKNGLTTINLNKQSAGIYFIEIIDCYGNANNVKVVKNQ